MRKLAKGRELGAGSTSISIRLAKGELERIQKIAVDQDRTVSNVCRRLILRGLPAEEARKENVGP